MTFLYMCNCKEAYTISVQSFYKGYPDGGGICKEACCSERFAYFSSLSDWNKDIQRTMEEDSLYYKNKYYKCFA